MFFNEGVIIRDSYGSIMAARSIQLGNVSMIMTNIALRDGVLIVAYNGFFNLEIEGDSKVIIDCCNKNNNNLPSSIIILMEDI